MSGKKRVFNRIAVYNLSARAFARALSALDEKPSNIKNMYLTGAIQAMHQMILEFTEDNRDFDEGAWMQIIEDQRNGLKADYTETFLKRRRERLASKPN